MDTTSYLPPKYSLNSFFVRHRAHPKRMKVIQGLNNASICSVNDVGYTYFPTVPADKKSQQLAFPPNNFNQTLLSHRKQKQQQPTGRNGLSLSDNEETLALEQQFVSKSQSSFSSSSNNPAPIKRREKARPPQGMWNTFGLVDNSDQWRNELNALASSVGLITPHDVEEYRRKREREEMAKELKERVKNKFPPPTTGAPRPPQTTTGAHNNVTSISRSGDQRVATTGRLNEPLPTGRRTGTRASRGVGGGLTGKKYIVEQGEREAWMIQVLCQILQTDNLLDVQSWLVSANEPDKERVKHLIDQAMKGLEESGRIEVNSGSTDEIAAGGASSLKEIESHLGKINLDKPVSRANLTSNNKRLYTSSSSSNHKQQQHKADILKIEEDDETSNETTKVVRESIKTPGTDQTGTVVSISVNNSDKNKRSPLDSAVIKLETPRGDFKIEQVKVTLLVKDDQTNQIQEVVGDWAPVDQSAN